MIETERLVLIPLRLKQLLKYQREDHALEKELNLTLSERSVSPELKEALEKTILPNVGDTTKNFLYSTLWTIINKAEKIMVGDICFHGEPNQNGEIEIGYGIHESFRKQGYMTEAVGGILKWAFTQTEVHSVLASTDKNNPDSFRILERNDFIKVDETETVFLWRRLR